MLLAIGDQETDFRYRRQLSAGARDWWKCLTSPAVSFWQFERSGIAGVLQHRKAGPMAREVLDVLGYPADIETLREALVHNDLLGAAFARLLLFTFPGRLPGPHQAEEGWKQYLWCWRPGRPHPERWFAKFHNAWNIENGSTTL